MAKTKHWMADLLVRVLPIWRGQVGFACELMETTIIGLTVKFSEIVNALNKVSATGHGLLPAELGRKQESTESIDNRIASIKKSIECGDGVAAIKGLDALQRNVNAQQSRYEKKIGEINQSNDEIKAQIEDVLVDLQFQDRVSQILRQVAQAQHQLSDVVQEDIKSVAAGQGLKKFDVDAWLAGLQESYAMEDQVQIHAGNRQSESKKVDEITFF